MQALEKKGGVPLLVNPVLGRKISNQNVPNCWMQLFGHHALGFDILFCVKVDKETKSYVIGYEPSELTAWRTMQSWWQKYLEDKKSPPEVPSGLHKLSLEEI